MAYDERALLETLRAQRMGDPSALAQPGVGGTVRTAPLDLESAARQLVSFRQRLPSRLRGLGLSSPGSRMHAARLAIQGADRVFGGAGLSEASPTVGQRTTTDPLLRFRRFTARNPFGRLEGEP